MQDRSPSSLRLLTALSLATVVIGFSLLVCGEPELAGPEHLHPAAVAATATGPGDDVRYGPLAADLPCDAPEQRTALLSAAAGGDDGDLQRAGFDARHSNALAPSRADDEAPDLRRLALLGIVLLGAGAFGLAARRGRRHVLGVGAAMAAIVGVALFWKLCAGVATTTETHFAQKPPATLAAATDVSHVAGAYLEVANGNGDGNGNGHHGAAAALEPASLDAGTDDVAAGATPTAWQDEDGGPSHRLLVLLGVGVLGAGALGAASRFGRRRFAATALALLGLALIAIFWQVCSGSGVYERLFGDGDDAVLARRADATGATGLAAGAAGLPGLAHAGAGTHIRGGAPAVAFRSGGTGSAAGLPAVGAGPLGGGGPRAAWGPVDGTLGASFLSGPSAVVNGVDGGLPAVYWTDGDSTGGGGGGGCQPPGCDPPGPAVPEPSAGLLFAAGLAAAASRLRRRA